MPRVDLTDYEIAHDLLPGVCARCGAPAVERVVHAIRIVDGWRGVIQLIGILLGFFFFPPLLAFAVRCVRPLEVGVPLCAADRDDHRRRERLEWRVLLPIWTVAALIMDALVLIDVAYDGPGIGCIGTWSVVGGAVVAAAIINRGRIQVMKPGKTGLRLTEVHPTFVAALMEDRARDRVSNPERRGGFGDVRDDYDDEPG
jgi:hypothetical protein